MLERLTQSYLWDLFITRKWEKMGSPEEREEKNAAARGILTPKAAAKEKEEYLRAAGQRLVPGRRRA